MSESWVSSRVDSIGAAVGEAAGGRMRVAMVGGLTRVRMVGLVKCGRWFRVLFGGFDRLCMLRGSARRGMGQRVRLSFPLIMLLVFTGVLGACSLQLGRGLSAVENKRGWHVASTCM